MHRDPGEWPAQFEDDTQGRNPSTGPRPAKKKKRRRKNYFEVFLRKVQKPEVILLAVWWLTMLSLVVYMADMGPLMWHIWKPLAVLLTIPVAFLLGVFALSL
mmetsp:Transcript_59948/g.111133  ORF Transcript_59948/g.111133 Transcript_59948/m.111133 type:complete len:102 (-) Transcript_59948:332-637(-)